MSIIQETVEIVRNAKAAYKRGEITAEQFCDVTRIPYKDAFLWLYENGGRRLALAVDIYEPFEKG